MVVDKKPYYEPDEEFRGTGLYMLIAGVAGLVLGLLFSFLLEHDEVATLAAVVAGGVVAGLLMAWVGHLLGPETQRRWPAIPQTSRRSTAISTPDRWRRSSPSPVERCSGASPSSSRSRDEGRQTEPTG